jgi:hypothetical protein
MNTIIVHADSKVSKALIALFKAMNVSFEVKKENKTEESPYNPEFVKMVLEAKKSNNRRVLDNEYKKELFGQL